MVHRVLHRCRLSLILVAGESLASTLTCEVVAAIFQGQERVESWELIVGFEEVVLRRAGAMTLAGGEQF